MEINKKNRTELKSFFKANDIPAQQHFAQFIDAGLNQAEDGIAKTQGSAIALQAEGDAVGTQEILNLFSDFTQDNPDWSLNLNPRVDPQASNSNQPRLNIKDATGQSRLFIKSGNGGIGLGTIEPEARLTVQGTGNGSLIAAIADTQQHSRIFEVFQDEGDGMLSLRSGDTTLGTRLSGALEKPSFFLGNVGVGTSTPSDKLTVYDGELALQTSNNNGAQGMLFQNSENSYTWRMYRKDAGSSFADLVFASGLEHDFTNLTDRITLRNNGNIGIGTSTPSDKLTV
ncbi:MAG: hypothetical protein KDD04_06820, partial [Sinomicrobium sp.]|nr:hypothetical protein [Sinomicrobium sp.]